MYLRGDRVGAYARFSSDKQSDASIDDQLRGLRATAERDGHAVDQRLTFTDREISGASTARPGFEALMAAVKRRELDVLLVESVDRLSRDQSDAHRLFKELKYYGVQLVAVSDGIDSSTKGAKQQYGLKALMGESYLDELADKTRRGMEGRAHAKLATGGRVLGYRTVALPSADPRRPAGSRIEIDPDGAALVRRIFALWIAGGSYNGIAAQLNADGVPSPRDKTNHGAKRGWGPVTIRAILLNERYVGVFTFNVREWVKVPGTNKRRPRMRDPRDVIRDVRPELRIIDDETWKRAQAKLAATAARFTRDDEGKRKGKALSQGAQAHPLSGLLRCKCGASMTIRGGDAKRGRYVECPLVARGRCKEKRVPLREALARACILGELNKLVGSSAAVARVRERIAERLGQHARECGAEIKERRERLARTEKRIANVIAAIADGERSRALSDALKDLEAQASGERREIEALEHARRAPVSLPSPDAIVARARDLMHRLAVNPAGARAELHALFEGQAIELELGADGVYVGRSKLLPLVLFRPVTPSGGLPESVPGYSSGGLQLQPGTEPGIPFVCRMAA